MKAAHAHPAAIAKKACTKVPCTCSSHPHGFDRSTCEDGYQAAVRQIIDRTVWHDASKEADRKQAGVQMDERAGFWNGLSDQQKQAALAYRGPENVGRMLAASLARLNEAHKRATTP